MIFDKSRSLFEEQQKQKRKESTIIDKIWQHGTASFDGHLHRHSKCPQVRRTEVFPSLETIKMLRHRLPRFHFLRKTRTTTFVTACYYRLTLRKREKVARRIHTKSMPEWRDIQDAKTSTSKELIASMHNGDSPQYLPKLQ